MSEPFKMGGKKHFNYCAKRVEGSKYCSFIGGEMKPITSVQDTNPKIDKIKPSQNDEGVEVTSEVLTNLQDSSRKVLNHLLKAPNGPVKLSQEKLAKELGYKSKEPVVRALKELQEVGLINRLTTFTGTSVDLKVNKDHTIKLLNKTTQSKLSVSGERVLQALREMNKGEIKTTIRTLLDKTGLGSSNTITKALEELKDKGKLKKTKSFDGTTITLTDEE